MTTSEITEATAASAAATAACSTLTATAVVAAVVVYAGFGGAVFNDAGTVTITNSTLSGNSAKGGVKGDSGATDGQGIGGALFKRVAGASRFSTAP
ncbi:MAG: hypothetical protein U0798_18585 [Gemmataceae bacterium]